MKKKGTISEAELAILEVLWKHNKSMTALEIRQALMQEKQWERTTILTLIRRLVDKEVILQEKKDVYYYSPSIQKEDYRKEETRDFVSRLYKGSSKALVAALVQDDSLTEEDISELRSYLNPKNN